MPLRCEAAVARIIQAGADRLAAVDPRELTARQAERVGTAIGQRIEAGTHDYFVQAFDEPGVAADRQPARPGEPAPADALQVSLHPSTTRRAQT